MESLSARRAWIEIKRLTCQQDEKQVALRKESVDRNTLSKNPVIRVDVALRKESVDRNITSRQLPAPKPPVALRKESVDRNGGFADIQIGVSCRSPQGERG